MKGFKKCSNGHWYKEDLAQCPYPSCKGTGTSLGGNVSTVTGSGNDGSTQVFTGLDSGDDGKTVIIGAEKTSSKGANKVNIKQNAAAIDMGKTNFIDNVEEETESGSIIEKKEQRSNRRLVGWLVTYSLDPLGIDYKIYEGRNVVGRDIDCNITVNDKTVTGKHATILFRADKYKIKDELSAHGTFVNDEDIEDNTFELNDGDIVKMGETVFKFKTSF
jgi:hypothetical protein